MRILKIRACAVLLMIALAVTVMPRFTEVYAGEVKSVSLTEEQLYDLDDAAFTIYEIMQLIMDSYAGGDVTVTDLYNAALGGISDILDPYSEFMTEDAFDYFMEDLTDEARYGIGAYLDEGKDGYVVIVELIDGMPAKESGVLPGDKIIAIDGKSMKGESMDVVRSHVLGELGEIVNITFLRGGKEITIGIKRAELTVNSITVMNGEQLAEAIEGGMFGGSTFEETPGDCGYISIPSVTDVSGEDLREAISSLRKDGVKKVILDLRDDGGGFLDQALSICSMLIPSGPIIHMRDSAGNTVTEYSKLEYPPFNKIVVLVNEYTASAAEIIASAVQDSGAGIVVGRQTYGKGIVQSTYQLEYGGVFKLTTEEYFSRNNKKINGVGVTPDINVELSTKDYSESDLYEAIFAAGYAELIK